MRCPTLHQLPPAPPDKNGWPWTEDSQPLPDTMPGGQPWPRLTIVTPSFNQAAFIEETIRSVLLQGYKDLEYIIIDGCSTDGTLDIIRKYESWLAYWVSEPDEGQSDALNKGFQRATGPIVAWLNSDDYYLPGILPGRVVEFLADPELVLVYGDCHRVDETGERINTWKTGQVTASSLLLDGNQIPQQSTFLRAATLAAIGGIDRELHYMMDYALWLRLGLLGKLKYIPGPVANFRKHRASKGFTAGYAFLVEEIKWLSGWADCGRILSGSERAEMLRCKHMTAALYAIFEGKEVAAASHFNSALRDKVWPYGDVDALAQKIVHFGGLAGHTMKDSWERYETLRRTLNLVEPAGMRRRLHRCVASQYHLLWALHNGPPNKLCTVRAHILRGLWYDPRQLGSRTVLYNSAQAFLGQRVANWLGRFVQRKKGGNES